MRDKYKQSVASNEKLKEKLREVSDSISRGDGQKNKLLTELKRWEPELYVFTAERAELELSFSSQELRTELS